MMTFADTVRLLLCHHPALWFKSDQDAEQFRFCDRWTGGEILSGAGRLLAMQAGHPDEWKLNINHTKPDCPYEPDECDEGEPITEAFLSNVRMYMTFNVYPNIDAQGDFIRDHTPEVSLDIENYCTIRASPACQRRCLWFLSALQ
ncbi:hypothetical protein RZZ46_17805 [Citrobacter amalonaticus]|uniref:hypothetical protein n=1 Tax=Citrobacter amalonaticus TaxID=35703 RepID=UPI0029334371|nr:hypothetical protein [Citrobacter amalonaticus]MEB0586572.1 hypothetical protein [Citrobacter amalonaticus]